MRLTGLVFIRISDLEIIHLPRDILEDLQRNFCLTRQWQEKLLGRVIEKTSNYIVIYDCLPNGTKNGYYAEMRDETILKTREYKDGKLHGESQCWYKNGMKYWHENWNNDIKHGEDRGWFDDGQPHWRKNWCNGQLDGKECGWYKNGKIWAKRHWRNGLLNGDSKFWNEDGELMQHYIWKEDEVIDIIAGK